MKVEELMSRRLFALPENATAEEASQLMARENIGLLPILTRGKLAGVITDRDLMTRCVAAGLAPNETILADIMTRKVVFTRPEETVMEASRLMAMHRVRRLPVCRGESVVGVRGLGDLARREATGFEAAMAISEISLPGPG